MEGRVTAPQNVYVLIPQACEGVTLHNKGTTAEKMTFRTRRWSDHPGGPRVIRGVSREGRRGASVWKRRCGGSGGRTAPCGMLITQRAAARHSSSRELVHSASRGNVPECGGSRRGTLVTSDDSDPTGPKSVPSGLTREKEREKTNPSILFKTLIFDSGVTCCYLVFS